MLLQLLQPLFKLLDLLVVILSFDPIRLAKVLQLRDSDIFRAKVLAELFLVV